MAPSLADTHRRCPLCPAWLSLARSFKQSCARCVPNAADISQAIMPNAPQNNAKLVFAAQHGKLEQMYLQVTNPSAGRDMENTPGGSLAHATSKAVGLLCNRCET